MKYNVSKTDAGQRLDVYLCSREGFPLTRSQLKKMIGEGLVLVNGFPSRAGQKLRENDSVSVSVLPPKPCVALPENIPLQVIFADDSILVIDKPAGMVVHPAAGNYSGTLVNALLFHCSDLSRIGGVLRPGIVHRLDKNTSGLMVIAKTDQAHRELARQFKEHSVKKIYKAFVFGELPGRTGLIEAAVGRHPVDRKRMSTVSKRAKEARTRWQVISSWKAVSLVELEIETGRTHQIRVHLNSIGHPIVGDNVYGNSQKRVQAIPDQAIRARLRDLKRQALHSSLLGFRRPVSGKYVEFTSKLPEDMTAIRGFLEGQERAKQQS